MKNYVRLKANNLSTFESLESVVIDTNSNEEDKADTNNALQESITNSLAYKTYPVIGKWFLDELGKTTSLYKLRRTNYYRDNREQVREFLTLLQEDKEAIYDSNSL